MRVCPTQILHMSIPKFSGNRACFKGETIFYTISGFSHNLRSKLKNFIERGSCTIYISNIYTAYNWNYMGNLKNYLNL